MLAPLDSEKRLDHPLSVQQQGLPEKDTPVLVETRNDGLMCAVVRENALNTMQWEILGPAEIVHAPIRLTDMWTVPRADWFSPPVAYEPG